MRNCGFSVQEDVTPTVGEERMRIPILPSLECLRLSIDPKGLLQEAIYAIALRR